MFMTDIDHLLKTILKTDFFTKEKLNKGLTNDNYLITVGEQCFICRVPKNDAHQIVHFPHEAKALELIKNAQLDVTTIFYDQETGIKITEYVPDFLTFEEYQGSDKIKRTACLMKRLHALQQTIGYDFDPIARYHQYRSYVKKAWISDARAAEIIQAIQAIPYVPTLCHNDWVSGNIGFTNERDYLIDYEYAGDNDPYFDVMSFITENKLTEDERKEFLETYFDHPLTSVELLALKAYEDFHNLLWCTWAIMMYESRNLDVYLHIAQDKLDQLNA